MSTQAPENNVEALVMLLQVALTATDWHQKMLACNHAADLAQHLTREQIEACKAIAQNTVPDNGKRLNIEFH